MKIRIRLVRSLIGSLPNQRKTAHSLGLRKINSFTDQDNSPSILGMVRKINHLVKIEEID